MITADAKTIRMWQQDADGWYICPETGERIKLHPTASVGEGARVGDRARVGEGARVGARASVGDGASVGKGASVGEGASVGAKRLILRSIQVGPIGSRNAMLYASTDGDSIEVSTGCFLGSLEQFQEAVNQTHGQNQYGNAYNSAIQVICAWFAATVSELKENANASEKK